MTRNRISLLFLLFLTAVTLCFGLVIVRPFLKPILFALALAMVFHPLHTWLRKRIRMDNAAALLSTFLVFLAMTVPALVLGRAITSELTELYQTLNGEGQEGNLALRWLDRGERWTNALVHQAGLSTFDIRSAIRQHIGQGSGWLLQQAAGFLGDLTGVLLGAMVTFITLFFLFREGASLRERLASTVPLAADHLERLFSGVHEVVVASVYGIFAIGLLQGVLVGLVFWLVGLPSPVLWGLVTSFLSLIPIVGTGGVWIPATILLMASGHWVKALILVAWGAGIVHPVDNILRPYLVGQRAKLSAIYLFFAILGGAKAFGLIGLVLGPVVLSVSLALLEILKNELKEWTSPLKQRHEGSVIGSLPVVQADARESTAHNEAVVYQTPGGF